MSIIPILNAATLASLASQTALRVTTMKGGGGTPPPKFAEDAAIGPWEGVRCCPSCMEPISEREKWSGCCSKCGHTESVYIHTKTRARRKVVKPDGSERWEWKRSAAVDSFFSFEGIFIFAMCMGGLALCGMLLTMIFSP